MLCNSKHNHTGNTKVLLGNSFHSTDPPAGLPTLLMLQSPSILLASCGHGHCPLLFLWESLSCCVFCGGRCQAGLCVPVHSTVQILGLQWCSPQHLPNPHPEVSLFLEHHRKPRPSSSRSLVLPTHPEAFSSKELYKLIIQIHASRRAGWGILS